MNRFLKIVVLSVLVLGLPATPAHAAASRVRSTSVEARSRVSAAGVRAVLLGRASSTKPQKVSVRLGEKRPPRTPAPLVAPETSRWVGFYVPGVPASLDSLKSLESQLGSKAKVVNFYVADTESFPLSRVQAVAGHGATPMVTLEFWSAQNGGAAAIANGSKDAYLRNFADAAKAYGGEVWLRPFHEMNGNWYPWCGTVNGNTPAQVVAAWKHVKSVFAERGATNVKFVWCANIESVPNNSANAIESYWPGDAYVDRVSLDGYNFGTASSWSTWRSFSSLYDNAYKRVTALTAKPLFIAEIGCVEQGGSKAAWIADMYQRIETTYTRIEGVCWFNADKAGKDWRVESSATSFGAFKTGMTAGF